ncbi:MAG: hypothetical protein K6C94_09670 [Candidatus Gastranaerophilales bacterium]|nr:hypothetical protein [Candidatus Gastranaerophilales bacterium]
MKVNLKSKLNTKAFAAISECIKIAQISGIRIYLVGGIVRDILLKKPIKDIDITVEGKAKDFVEILDCYVKTRKIIYHEMLPTVKVVFKNGTEIDFASTRKEVYKKSGDLPVVTEIGCPLKDDIKRRDFTVNSIAISLNSDDLFEIIDYTNGLNDLQKKQLKVLHDKSYTDDPSRLIRCLKFAQRLDFKPEDKTLELQKKYLDNPLQNIPLSRIKKELKDLFSLNKASCFDDFAKQKLYKIFVPKLNTDISGEDIRNIIFDFKVDDDDIWLLYLIPFFLDNPVPEKFNFTAREIKVFSEINNFYKRPLLNTDKYSVYEYFSGLDYLSVIYYAVLFDINIIKMFNKIKNIKVCFDGKDLQNLGIPQGKIYSEIQKTVLREKINNGNLKTKNDEINYIKKIFADKK